MDKHGLMILKHFKIEPVSLPLTSLEPSEWDTWTDAITELKIRLDYPINNTTILCDLWDSSITVMDGHHRVASAIMRGETMIDSILLPSNWTESQRDAFWNVFNHRNCNGLCKRKDCKQAKIIIDNMVQ